MKKSIPRTPADIEPSAEPSTQSIRAEQPRSSSARVTTLRGIGIDGTVLIDVPGEPAPRPALLALAASSTELLSAIRDHLRVLSMDTPEGWVIVGLVRDRLDVDAAEDRRDADAKDHVEVRARESLELVCGRARLRLDKSGQIAISATDISEEASGTMRIAAADVRIN